MEQEKEDLQMVQRHSMSHVLAAAIKSLFGEDVKFGIGPAIDNGFYYDFDMEHYLTPDDFDAIENKMREIIAQNLDIKKTVISKQKALELFKDQQYKVELINDLPENEEISIYELGDVFMDLCRGPHVENTKMLRGFAFKINRVSGAYWRGNEKNKMMQRMYVYGFSEKQALKDYLFMLEEALKRDHRKIGKELDLFFFDETAPGMVYWLPKGFTILNTLIEFWREEHNKNGYQEFSAPLLNNSTLWKTSGHWDHYKDDMYVLEDSDGVQQALKPMNCPNSIRIYQNKMRSYKDLPLRFNDVDIIHRNEKSGQLNGLFRVRQFRQDDSHNYITDEQIGSEIKNIVKIAHKFYGIFNLPYELTLSTRPENYMGDIAVWDKAEAELKHVLNEICGENNYRINEGDGAFYGPKIDIKMKDCLGREWQMGTIQLDFQLPIRFDLSYISQDGEKKRPIMIHRAIFGSLERFIGILIEHYAGAFPVWLSPVQAIILPISEKFLPECEKIKENFEKQGIRIALDDRNEKIGYKIRNAQMQKIPYSIVIGESEINNNNLSVRERGNKDSKVMEEAELINEIKSKIENKN